MAKDRHQRAARYGAHPPACSCESCAAKRLGMPDPKEARRRITELKEEPKVEVIWPRQEEIGD